MLKHITYFFSAVTVMMGVTGCTNTPTVTKADIPLVHSSLAYSLNSTTALAINIPRANMLFDTNDLIPIIFNGVRYQSKERYISATGNKCIRFVLSDSGKEAVPSATRRKLTSCERDGVWVLINPLVGTTNMEGV
jgi:hypothetical protein